MLKCEARSHRSSSVNSDLLVSWQDLYLRHRLLRGFSWPEHPDFDPICNPAAEWIHVRGPQHSASIHDPVKDRDADDEIPLARKRSIGTPECVALLILSWRRRTNRQAKQHPGEYNPDQRGMNEIHGEAVTAHETGQSRRKQPLGRVVEHNA